LEFALLHLRRQLAKAGLVLQLVLLLVRSEVLVILQPALKVGLALGGRTGLVGCRPTGVLRGLGGALLGTLLGALRSTLLGGRGRSRHTSASAGKRRHSSEQHKECRAKAKPGWAVRIHDKDDAPFSVEKHAQRLDWGGGSRGEDGWN
jgi:hypothetical protein